MLSSPKIPCCSRVGSFCSRGCKKSRLISLREHNVALALTDLSNIMPRPWELKDELDLVTADFVYVGWLADRKGIDALTTT